jgi:hypothetical protein
MRERLVAVGGTLDLANAAAGGARQVARVPVVGA